MEVEGVVGAKSSVGRPLRDSIALLLVDYSYEVTWVSVT